MFGKEKEDKAPKRFAVKCQQHVGLSDFTVFTDQNTGVQYLLIESGFGLSCQPLLDSGGRVLTEPPTV